MVMCKAERRPWLAAALAMLALLAVPGSVLAQSGEAAETIRPGDVLQMVVPGRPDLDRTLIVDQAGSVDIPQVGEVRLSGLTLGEAGVMLKQRLRLIAPTLDTVELGRAESASFRVYVIGQVGNPGVHEFTMHPTVWDVIRAAGGPLDSADLRKARVIREEEGQPGTLSMDLSKMLEGEDFPTIVLRDGDTLVIPALPDGVSGVASDRGVKVFGGVGVPSIVLVEGPTPLMDVLMLAGSPTADANVEKIWWVHSANGVDEAQRVNLRLFLERGDPLGNPLIHPGDTVDVTLAKPGRFMNGFAFLLGTAAAVAAIYVAVNQTPN
jgi:protein involved in polysaccharide export with SLBB domain